VPLKPNQVYLLDSAGDVIAKNGRRVGDVRKLDGFDRSLARALAESLEGEYESRTGRQRYASRHVPGTPWRVAISMPTDLLYSSVGGARRWLPWLAVVGFALGGLLVVGLLARLLESRSRLATANVALERLSRIDSLTGLHNRRHGQEVLDALVSASRRHERVGFAVLLVDIDRFKRINDTYGHHAGDAVLRATAEAIAAMLREEDAVARWGGEEFLLALPGVGADGASATAERLRKALRKVRVSVSDGASATVTVTVGVAVWEGESSDELVTRADAALYRGKALGRDRVEIDPSPSPVAG
jgi:diguanylate cyclase (GGDEF)-like protein